MAEVGDDIASVRGYRVEYTGPHPRLGVEGLWYKKFESWDDPQGRKGCWRWVRPEEVPEPQWQPRIGNGS